MSDNLAHNPVYETPVSLAVRSPVTINSSSKGKESNGAKDADELNEICPRVESVRTSGPDEDEGRNASNDGAQLEGQQEFVTWAERATVVTPKDHETYLLIANQAVRDILETALDSEPESSVNTSYSSAIRMDTDSEYESAVESVEALTIDLVDTVLDEVGAGCEGNVDEADDEDTTITDQVEDMEISTAFTPVAGPVPLKFSMAYRGARDNDVDNFTPEKFYPSGQTFANLNTPAGTPQPAGRRLTLGSLTDCFNIIRLDSADSDEGDVVHAISEENEEVEVVPSVSDEQVLPIRLPPHIVTRTTSTSSVATPSDVPRIMPSSPLPPDKDPSSSLPPDYCEGAKRFLFDSPAINVSKELPVDKSEECDRKSVNELIPVSKGYNLDFLDKLDDPSFNPFETKACIADFDIVSNQGVEESAEVNKLDQGIRRKSKVGPKRFEKKNIPKTPLRVKQTNLEFQGDTDDFLKVSCDTATVQSGEHLDFSDDYEADIEPMTIPKHLEVDCAIISSSRIVADNIVSQILEATNALHANENTSPLTQGLSAESENCQDSPSELLPPSVVLNTVHDDGAANNIFACSNKLHENENTSPLTLGLSAESQNCQDSLKLLPPTVVQDGAANNSLASSNVLHENENTSPLTQGLSTESQNYQDSPELLPPSDVSIIDKVVAVDNIFASSANQEGIFKASKSVVDEGRSEVSQPLHLDNNHLQGTPKSVKFCEGSPIKISPLPLLETTSEGRIEFLLNKIKSMKGEAKAAANSTLTPSDCSFSLPSSLDLPNIHSPSRAESHSESDSKSFTFNLQEMSVLASQGGDLQEIGRSREDQEMNSILASQGGDFLVSNGSIETSNANENSSFQNMTSENLSQLVLQHEAMLLEKDKQLAALGHEILERQGEVEKLRWEMATCDESNDQMMGIVGEFEMTIEELIKEKERECVAWKIEQEKVEQERDQVLEDLQAVERAFKDLHRKYERTKEVIGSFKKNEDVLKSTVSGLCSRYKKGEERYQVLKTHAETKLQEANVKLNDVKNSKAAEIARLTAALRKAEIGVASLEREAEQKTSENQELSSICDELISKVGVLSYKPRM